MADTAVFSADGKWSVSGTTATYKVNGTVVAKITGLASGLKIGTDGNAGKLGSGDTWAECVTVTAGDANTAGTIKLKQAALGTSAKTVLTLSNGGSYKLALDGVTALEIDNVKLSTSSGKATLTGDVTTGYLKTDDKTIVYSAAKTGVTLATVSGLVSSIPDGAVTAPIGTSKDITLSLAAFNKKKVTLSSGYGYKLALDTTETDDGYTEATADTLAHTGGVTQAAAWTVSGTTATYKQTKTAQYDLASDGKSVTYTAAKTATLATVKGLAKNLDAATVTSGIGTTDSNTDGVADAGSNITLDSTVLGTTKTVTLVNGKGLDGTTSTYKLALATSGNVPATSTDNTQVWAVSGTTAIYKTVTPAHYAKTNDTTITYNKQKDVAKLATVKGLAKGLKTGTDATKLYASDGTTEVAEASAAANATAASKGTITIQQGALAKNNATITSDVYKFGVLATGATGALIAPQITPTWSVSGTTATLKGTVNEGWEKTSDTQITYTKATAAGKYATLATVKGLTTGLTTTALANNTGAIKVSVDEMTGKVKKDSGVATITLTAAALGTKDITLSGTGYELALDSDEVRDKTILTSTSDVVTSGKDVWRLKDTTATYKSVTPAYYAYGKVGNTTTDDKTKILYKAEADKENGTIATVTGLKAGLTAKDDGIYADATAVLTSDASAEKDGSAAAKAITIQLKKGALTTGNVTLTPATGKFAYLALDSITVSAPTTPSPTWYIGDKSDDTQTVAEIRSSSTEGWTLDSGSKAVTYAPNSSDALLATVTGLKPGLEAGTGTNEGKIGAIVNGNWTDYVSLAKDGSGKLTTEIVLTANALGEQNIAVTGDYGYTFKADTTTAMVGFDAKDTSQKPGSTDMWVLGTTGTTADYKSMVPKYFRYGTLSGTTTSDPTTLLYNGASAAGTAATYSLAGLATGLVVDTDGKSIDDAEGNDVIKFDNNTNPTKISVTGGALDGTGNLTLTTSTSVVFATPDYTTDGIIKNKDTFTLTYSDTAGTATLLKGSTEGYSLSSNSKVMVHTAFKASDEGTTVASITGLAKGLNEDDVAGTDGTGKDGYIDYGTTTGKIKIVDKDSSAAGVQNPVLGQSSIVLTSETYTFDTFADTTGTDATGWKIDTTAKTATLYETDTQSSYKLENTNKQITYTKPTLKTAALAVVTGLNSSIATDAENQIEGVTVDPTASNEKITLTLAALGGTSVHNTKSGSAYKFNLQQDNAALADFVPDPLDTTNTWSIANGTLTYKVETPDSYTVASGGSAILFTKGFVDTTTITGLKSSLNRLGSEVAAKSNGEEVAIIDGIKLVAPVKSTTTGVDDTPGTFKIGSAALGKKNITLANDVGNTTLASGDFDYNIALGDDVDNKFDENNVRAVWNKTNKTTTATYTQTFDKGYTLMKDKLNVVYASKKTKKTLATLTGLNKDVVANGDGSITGITPPLEGVSAVKTVTGSGSTATYTYDTVAGIFVLSDPNLFTTTNITLGKTDNYALSVAAGFGPSDADLHWSYTKGTAKLVTGTTEGWQLKETVKNGTTTYDNKTVEYKKADETSKTEYTKATITGLNTALEINDDGMIDGLDFSPAAAGGSGTVYIGAAAVEGITGKKDVTISGTSYVLAHANDLYLPQAEEAEWVVNKGTATYQYDVSEGWTLDSTAKKLSHSDALTEKTAVVLTTITGLNPALEAAGEDIVVTNDAWEMTDDGTAYENVSSSGVITLSAKALEGTKTVKFKESTKKYDFALAEDVLLEGRDDEDWKSQNGWVTNGTNAAYKTGYDKEHYKLTDGSIAFVAATKGTDVATVKGIKKDSVITDDDVQDGLIKLNSTHLDGKTITVTGEGYALALDMTGTYAVDDTELSKLINKKWKTTGNKAALTGTLTKGYKTSADGKTITYTTKDTPNKAIATVSGIKNPVSIKDNVSGTVITLNKAQLDGKAVTVTNSMPEYEKYTLALGQDVATPVIDATTVEWAAKGDTATLTGKIKTAGYTVAPDEQSIAYTAATTTNKTATLATIKGINQSTEIAATLPDLLKGKNSNGNDVTDLPAGGYGTITLRNELLGTNGATIDGKDLFAFAFEDDYSNKTVTGSTVSDNLAVTGSGVSVNAGKGNDVIDFTSAGGGNTLVYASGDGDDVVKRFTDSDIIKSDKVVITGDNIKTDGSDVLVTIGKNTITLKDYSGSTLTITDKNGTKTYESQNGSLFWTESTSASDVLLADDNYSQDAAALSDIVEPFKASYTPYDFDGGLDLVKKDSFAPAITYTGTDKK